MPVPDPSWAWRLALHAMGLDENGLHTGGSGGLEEVNWFNVRDYGAVGDNSTDDTSAIQDAIDACAAAGGGTIWFPLGTYIVGGALQDTSAFNGQLLLPDVDVAGPQVTIAFRGSIRPPLAIVGPEPADDAYSIIRSTLTGATGTAAVVSGGNGPHNVYRNNLQVIWQDLILLVPANPTLTGLNLSACQGGIVKDNWFCDAGAWYSQTHAEPTHSNAYGYKLPQKRNSWYTVAEGNGVAGFYTGFLQGEMVASRGGLGAAFCIYGMELPEVEHLSVIQEFGFTAVQRGIRVTGFHPFVITAMDMQHDGSPAWAVTVYDLDDASNLGLGSIAWWSGNAVSDHTFTKNGGANVVTYELGSPTAEPSGAAGGDLGGTYPNPTVTDDSHSHTASTIDLTGEAAGGDLSGTYPNPSVVDDSHSHTSATVSGLAANAVGPILIADVHSTPIVFGDFLLTEEEDDLLYADP